MLKLFAAPLIGALIGYCTNYIAVKMLFYPRKEIRFLGHVLPFTPGAIPKGQKRLASAIGKIVEEELLTKEDIMAKLSAPEVSDGIVEQMLMLTEHTIQETALGVLDSQEKIEAIEKTIVEKASDEILVSVNKLPLTDIIMEKGMQVIKARTAGTMLQMFLSDELIASITGPVGEEISAFIQENGRSFVETEVLEKIHEIEERKISDFIIALEPEEDRRKEAVIGLYQKVILQSAEGLLKNLGIAEMIEAKIAAMPVVELENLVLTVMKKELNTIVNLGALIGFLLGLLNLVL